MLFFLLACVAYCFAFTPLFLLLVKGLQYEFFCSDIQALTSVQLLMEIMGSHYWFLFGEGNGRGTLQSGAETYGIVFSTREPASSQEHTHIRSKQRE